MMALDGITVLDLSRVGPGPYATMLMADFGARVIKVEDARQGDDIRHLFHVNGIGAGHLVFNRNKESIGLNLKDPRGRAVFLELAEKADVVLESFRPGVVDRLGVGYEDIKAINPRVIYCSISGYGQDGPYRLRPGHDINYISVAGLLGMTGLPDGTPVMPGFQVGDASGGMFAALGTLLALRAREGSGTGQYLDVSMMDGSLHWLFEPFFKYLASGTSPRPGSERLSGGIPSYNIYRTKDGRHISLGILEPHFWRNLCELLQREDLLEYQSVVGEKAAYAKAELAAIFAARTLDEWREKLDGVEVCWAPVSTFDEAFDDPQVQHRGLLIEDSHPVAGKIRQLGMPIRLSGTPGEVGGPAPAHGEHTVAIMAELGHTPEEAHALRHDGVLAF